MPPRYAVVSEPSPSPPPENDAQDILVIQDIMDTLDQIPPELTRVHSDLNELGAVLYSTLVNLETKLNQLISWIQDPTIESAKRFQLLQEIAEEAARYKLGGDDKIRVAGGACDGIMAHQRHISNLLAASTLLVQAPLSPYTQSLTLQQAPVYQSSRRQVARAVNSPFGGPVGRSAPTTTGTGDTPTKKKKNRIQAIGLDDDMSSVTGEKKKAPIKKRKPTNRAASPADSLASASAFTGNKPMQPQTARQLAAAANKAKKAERADDSDEDSDDDNDAGALGLDVGSREGSHMGSRSINDTPVLPNVTVGPTANGRRRGGVKRSRPEDESDPDSGIDEDDGRNLAKRGMPKKDIQAPHVYDMDERDADGGENGEVDSKVYCTCRQVSYGEMIGCDDDDCEIEWYHIACIGLDRTPAGTWICPQCTERRKRSIIKKKAGKPRAKK